MCRPMALLAEIERRFRFFQEKGRLERALVGWQSKSQALASFPDLEALIGFCRGTTEGDLDLRDGVIAFLCRQAAVGDERAAILVIWLHLPGLWQATDDLKPIPEIHAEDLDAELLSGFWQAAKGAHREGGISARLVTRAYWTAWESVQGQLREIARRSNEDLLPEAPTVGSALDALQEAEAAGIVSDDEARLIEAVRLVGITDEELARGAKSTKNAVRKRRLRAEARVVAWIADEVVPLRRNLDGRGLKGQKAGSCVSAGSSKGTKASNQVERKEESPKPSEGSRSYK